jgi:hypothetical protein
MVEKFGSDQQQIATLGGGVISEDGATLLSGESLGESALLFGPAALREIKAGVANGDFAIAPADDTATITDDNPLPYWTFTDVSSEGAITAALVADAGAASGNVLRFTVASGTLTGKSATLSRFIPIPSSSSRSFSFYAEATFESGTASPQSTVEMSGEFYQIDQATVTGSPITSDTYTFSSLAGVTGITAPDLYAVAPDLTTMTAPADAAFLKITITIATVATHSADRTVDLTEVRVTAGLPELLITDRDDPTNPPAIINASGGELNVQSGAGNYLLIAEDSFLVASDSVSILTAGTIELQTETNVLLYAPGGVDVTDDLNVDGSVNVGGTIGVFGNINIGVSDTSTVGDITFKGGNGGSIRAFSAAAGNDSIGIYNTAGSGFTNLVAESFFPGGQGSFRLTHDGNFDFNDTVDVTGSITATGNITATGTLNATGNVNGNNFNGTALICDGIPTTTNTTNNAVWVNNTGTNYTLRRFTSSQRYKTNIVDVDEVVIEAAKKIKPRHFTSTLPDENGATRLGFIAEEIEAAGLTHAVGYDSEGRVESLDSMALIAALFARVNDLEERLKVLEG